ncbi:FHA domain protein [Hyalangium minutum]|uniref:FHA domain protein n=1 Tax=Hyalangium minutum TaxID=394096 RepID=A0A085VU22_9BACT|nr:FHA domain protein [Hyalangium minutum]
MEFLTSSPKRGGSWPKLLVGTLVGGFVLVYAGGEALSLYHRHRGPSDPVAPVREKERQRVASPSQPGLQDSLTQVEKEIPNHAHLRAAQAKLMDQKLAAAKAELDAISPDTTLFEQVNALKRQLRAAADKGMAEADHLGSAGKREEAMALLQEVLSVFPDDEQARLLQVKWKPREACWGLSQPPPPPPSVPAWTKATRRFMDKDLPGAMAIARACKGHEPRCKPGLQELEEFNKLYLRLESLNARQLLRLSQLDKQITGTSTPSQLGSLVAQRADQLKAQAKDHFLQGDALKDSEPAKARSEFQQVTAKTSPDDELHQKARAWLGKLARK